jgi:hypothetical protein
MSRRRRFALIVLTAVVCAAAFAWRWHGPRKSAAAFEQARAGAARGEAEAQYHLGVSRDVQEAIRYLRQAADHGNPQAQCQLARMYSEGRELPWNRTEAFRLYRAAADQGNAGGEYGLAYLYSHGAPEERDYAEAARWALKAAAQGDTQAQSYLGGAYWRGRGVARDYAAAARWYGKAAGHGDRAANLFLAAAYWRGEGLSRNYIKSAYYFAKVLGPLALGVLRRYGWTMYGGLLLLIAGAFAPQRLWRGQQWLSLAAISIAAAMLLFHFIVTSHCTVVWRLIAISYFGVVAIGYGTGAVQGAVRYYKERTSA